MMARKRRLSSVGEVDNSAKYVASTLLKDVSRDDVLMSEYAGCSTLSNPRLSCQSLLTSRDIFCPILPVLPVKDVDEQLRS